MRLRNNIFHILTKLRARRRRNVSISGSAQDTFLLSKLSRPDLGPKKPPIQWVTETTSPGLKRPGREADCPPLSSAEINNKYHTPVCLRNL
jgi:hypothetical protein